MKKLLAILGIGAVLAVLAWLIGPSFLRSAGDMDDPRSEVHAAQLDGVIYVTGGIGFFRTLDSCAAFDTTQESFAQCPDLPRALHHVAMTAGEDQVFASGGYSSLPFVLDEAGALFSLDPSGAEPQWRELTRLPEPLGQHAMVHYDGGVWLVGGDRNGVTTGALTRFDLATKSWEEKTPMPTARHSHAVAIGDGKLYVTGGRSDELGSQSRVIEVYDFTTDSWRALPDAPFDLGGHGAALYDGRLHVFGGEDIDTGQVVQKHALFDLSNPQTGWIMGTPMALPRHGFATARIGSKAWIIAGGKRAGMRTPWSVTGGAFELDLR